MQRDDLLLLQRRLLARQSAAIGWPGSPAAAAVEHGKDGQDARDARDDEYALVQRNFDSLAVVWRAWYGLSRLLGALAWRLPRASTLDYGLAAAWQQQRLALDDHPPPPARLALTSTTLTVAPPLAGGVRAAA